MCQNVNWAHFSANTVIFRCFFSRGLVHRLCVWFILEKILFVQYKQQSIFFWLHCEVNECVCIMSHLSDDAHTIPKVTACLWFEKMCRKNTPHKAIWRGRNGKPRNNDQRLSVSPRSGFRVRVWNMINMSIYGQNKNAFQSIHIFATL